MRVAALDFGSNTFLLLICEFEQGRLQKVLADETEVVRLAQGMDQNKSFHPEALMRARQCLESYSRWIQHYKPEKIMGVATSAARDAENKAAFLDLVAEFGIPLKIIEGSTEAALTYKGSVFDQPPGRSHAIIDVGGGSTEIIGKSEADQVKGWSVDVGSVRLTERLITAHPLASGELDRLRHLVEEEFDKVKDRIPSGPSLEVIAVAGTPVALAQLEHRIDFNEDRIHGTRLHRDQISSWCERLSKMSVEDRLKLPGMPAKRADVLVAGCAILEGALRALDKTELRVSTKGVRYGVALSLAENLSI